MLFSFDTALQKSEGGPVPPPGPPGFDATDMDATIYGKKSILASKSSGIT